ncbi:MAG: hypothetical protein IPN24_18460 [Betaproteobacteria bacterium]|nr:hypothetical protein [Betaproteobacteria bacterium]
MSKRTLRSILDADELGRLDPDRFAAAAVARTGMTPAMLQAVLTASVDARHGDISAGTVRALKAAYSSVDPQMIERAVEHLNQLPPGQRVSALASMVTGGDTSRGGMADTYDRDEFASRVIAKRMGNSEPVKAPKLSANVQSDVDANRSRRRAVEAAVGLPAAANGMVNAMVSPDPPTALVGIIESSHHVLANSDLVDRRTSVEAAWDAHSASDMAEDLLGVPARPDDDD